MRAKSVCVGGFCPTVIRSASGGSGHDPIVPNGSAARRSLGFRAHTGDSGPSLPRTARGISASTLARPVIRTSCPALWRRTTG